MNSKTSVSLLQEHAAKNFLPPPQYNTITKDIGLGFECICMWNGSQVSAIAGNKKDAKQLSAQKMIVTHRIADRRIDSKPVITPQITTQVASLTQEVCNYNAIGNLNEYCSKNAYEYPKYNEMGFENGNFIIQCEHRLFVTEGSAANKKIAKQLSAHKMLLIVQGDKTEQQPIETKPVVQVEEKYSNNQILEQYQKLRSSLSPNKLQDEKISSFSELDSTVVEEKVNVNTANQVLSTPRLEVQDDIVRLESDLKKMNINYKVDEVSNSPCILVFQNLDSERRIDCFMESGPDYLEVKKALFSTVLNFYKRKTE